MEASEVQWQDVEHYQAGQIHSHLEGGHLKEVGWWAKVEVLAIVYIGQAPLVHPIAPELCFNFNLAEFPSPTDDGTLK